MMPGVDWSDKVDQEMRCRDWREIRVGLNSAFNLNGDRDNIFAIYTFGPFGFIRICSHLQNLRLGIKSVEEYTKEFYELVSHNEISDSEEQLVSRYLGGLRQSIQDVLCLYTFWSISKACQRALAIEKQQKRSGNHFRGSQTKSVKSKQVEHGDKSQEQDVAISKRPIKRERQATYDKNEKLETYDYKDEVEYNVGPRYDKDKEYEENIIYNDVGQMLVIRKTHHLVKSLLGKYTDVMSMKHPSGLPPMRNIQHQIDLIPGSSLPNKTAYYMSLKEHGELQRQVEEAIEKGLIRVSMTPCVVPTLLTPQKDGDERKTDFKTREGLHEGIVMPFGLSNALSTFMRVMNHVLKPFLQKFVVSDEGIKVDESKVQAIVEWPTPHSIHDVRSFHGLASFYRRFIRNFISLVSPITQCMRANLKFYWTLEANESFRLIKKKISQALVLALPNFRKVFEVDYDASKVKIGVVISQEEHPVSFFSGKLSGSRLNYTTYDVEFYAIVRALRHWKHYLMHNEFILNSNHEALKYINN
nr:hypothetical protein [Tanacetum cinerariifolium]